MFVSPDFDDEAFTHDGLIEASAVLEFQGDYLIPNTVSACEVLGNGKHKELGTSRLGEEVDPGDPLYGIPGQ